jgi:hypothetical protein
MIKVENRHKYSGVGVYVGRPSALGNPFVIGKDGDRAEVIEKYRQWLRREYRRNGKAKVMLVALSKCYKRGDGITLICSCAPQACHADVIAEAIPRVAATLVDDVPAD